MRFALCLFDRGFRSYGRSTTRESIAAFQLGLDSLMRAPELREHVRRERPQIELTRDDFKRRRVELYVVGVCCGLSFVFVRVEATTE